MLEPKFTVDRRPAAAVKAVVLATHSAEQQRQQQALLSSRAALSLAREPVIAQQPSVGTKPRAQVEASPGLAGPVSFIVSRQPASQAS